MQKGEAFVLGVDYASDSVRTVLVDAANGENVAASVFYYFRWKEQLYCNIYENQFRQHLINYLEGLERTIKVCIAKGGNDITANIKAIL